jgi:hypothetical protein
VVVVGFEVFTAVVLKISSSGRRYSSVVVIGNGVSWYSEM